MLFAVWGAGFPTVERKHRQVTYLSHLRKREATRIYEKGETEAGSSKVIDFQLVLAMPVGMSSYLLQAKWRQVIS